MKINTLLIKQRREALNLTQQQLADMVNSCRAMICHIEKGNASPSIRKLPLYAKALGVTESELLIFSHTN